jgi:ribokinase
MTIHVIGNVAIDETLRVARMPRPGESIPARSRTRDLGGKGANQAIVLSRAGLDVRLVAAVGNDDAAAWIRRELTDEGLQTGGLVALECASDSSVIVLDERAENMIITTRTAAGGLDPARAMSALATADSGDTLLVQGNLAPDLTQRLVAFGRERGLTTVFNPSPVDPAFAGMLSLVDVVVLNRTEAMALTGRDVPADGAYDLRARGVGSVVVTLGADGALLLDRTGPHHVPAAPATPVDTTGAGDTFIAILVAARSLIGQIDTRCVAAANVGAAVTASRLGTRAAFPLPSEIRAILAHCR